MTDTADGDCALTAADSAPLDAVLRQLAMKPAQLFRLRQIHGDVILRADGVAMDGARPQVLGDADALMTDRCDAALGISIADCIPVFVAVPGRAVGVAHAGREGTRLGIAGKLVSAMAEAYEVASAEMLALIGPGAGPCCYEVSAEIASAWKRQGLPVEDRRLDLWSANRRSLEGAGLNPASITVSGQCTICGDKYHSFRRQGGTARNLAIAKLK